MITAAIWLFVKSNWKAFAIIGAVVVIVGGVYLKGRSDASEAAKSAARKQLVEQITERNEINEAVSNLSAADLCVKLGGVYAEGECK